MVEIVVTQLMPQFPQQLTQKMQDAKKKVKGLEGKAEKFIEKRDNKDFRTGSKGNPANAGRYSNFVGRVKKAVTNMLSGNPSYITHGYTELNMLANDIGFYTIDQIAKDSVREGLNITKHSMFDSWFRETQQLLYELFKDLRDTVRAVSVMHRTS